MFTHWDVCDAIHDRGGEYLLFVKDNQEVLRADIELLFAGRPAFPPPYQQRLWDEDGRAATTREKGHGRVEVRTIATSTWANGYADWPRVAQVFRLERELASLRNVAVYVLNRMEGVPSLAAATRRVAANPAVVLPWLGLPDPTTE